jgi:SagB-type dehydrogenase family enzyme
VSHLAKIADVFMRPIKFYEVVDVLTLVVILSMLLLTACALWKQSNVVKTAAQATASRTGEIITPTPQTIILPAPRLKGTLTFEEVLAKRRSVREFTEEQLTLEEIGQLLWAAQGITHSAGYRTAPSAGALYPLEVYVITQDGVYHYDPQEHRLSVHMQGDMRPALHAAALRQEPGLKAPAVFVITAVYERIESKYGKERGPRYVHLEAGHAAQNILLQAVALDLGAVPIGAFQDDKVKEVLSLPPNQQPLYLIPVGHPD